MNDRFARRLRRGCLRATSVVLVAFAPGALAATYTVDTVADMIDDDVSDGLCHTVANTCSLRAAIMQANVATAPLTTIMVPAGHYVLVRPPIGANNDDSGDLTLMPAPPSGAPVIAIVGASAATTIIDAAQIDRVLQVRSARMARISDVTLRGGLLAATYGGAIENNGNLTLDRVLITGNRAAAGGGINNNGTLTLRDSTMDNNTADSDGGAIRGWQGILTIARSTLSNNHAGFGGGLIAVSTTLIINSSIVGNDARGYGGGIWAIEPSVQREMEIFSSTIAYNDADHDQNDFGVGGGIYVQGTNQNFLHLYNTLVAGNTFYNQPLSDDCNASTGFIVTHARVLFGDTAGCHITAASGSFGLLNAVELLGPLADNGGPTKTVALLPGSNAINGGSSPTGCTDELNNVLLSDQRGFARAIGNCDIGAFEYNPAPPVDALFKDGFE